MTHTISTQNRKTPIIIFGNSNKKTPIIFIPGFNMRVNDYKNYLQYISKERIVYGIEIFKTKPRPKSIKENTKIILEIVNSLKLKKFDLIGNSFGAGVAFEVSAKTNKANKTIGVNPLLDNEYKTQNYIAKFFKVASYKIFTKFIFYFIFGVRAIPNLPSLLKNLKSINKYKLNSTIKNSSLIMISENDEFFSEKQIKKTKFKKLKIIKTKGRHLNIINHYKEIGNKTLEFLK